MRRGVETALMIAAEGAVMEEERGIDKRSKISKSAADSG